MSSVDDIGRAEISNFFFQKFSEFKFSMPYLESAWKISSNEYKQVILEIARVILR